MKMLMRSDVIEAGSEQEFFALVCEWISKSTESALAGAHPVIRQSRRDVEIIRDVLDMLRLPAMSLPYLATVVQHCSWNISGTTIIVNDVKVRRALFVRENVSFYD